MPFEAEAARRLEIVSEASRRLPAELKARHPSIEWREMVASGNIYRYEYEMRFQLLRQDVAVRRVWQTLTVSLPLLDEASTRELEALDGKL